MDHAATTAITHPRRGIRANHGMSTGVTTDKPSTIQKKYRCGATSPISTRPIASCQLLIGDVAPHLNFFWIVLGLSVVTPVDTQHDPEEVQMRGHVPDQHQTDRILPAADRGRGPASELLLDRAGFVSGDAGANPARSRRSTDAGPRPRSAPDRSHPASCFSSAAGWRSHRPDTPRSRTARAAPGAMPACADSHRCRGTAQDPGPVPRTASRTPAPPT